MIQLRGLVLSIMILSACSQSETQPDLRVWDDSLAVRVLTDAFIYHAAFSDTYGPVKDSVSTVFSNQLYDKYNLTKEEFEFNLDRIFQEPAIADSMYRMILKRVEKLEQKIDFENQDKNPMIQ